MLTLWCSKIKYSLQNSKKQRTPAGIPSPNGNLNNFCLQFNSHNRCNLFPCKLLNWTVLQPQTLKRMTELIPFQPQTTFDPHTQTDLGFCSLGWVGATSLPAAGVRTPASQLHTSARICPKERPRLGTRSPGRPPTPVRQHRPGPEVEGRLLAGRRLLASPCTAWRPLNTAVTAAPRTGEPRTPALTFDHLRHQRGPCALPAHDSKASGRRGGGKDRVAREQPAAERGGAATTPPKFKKTEFKGPRPSAGHSDARRPPTTRRMRASQLRKFKTSQTSPNRAATEWGAETSPSRPGRASGRLGAAGRSSAAPGLARQQLCTWRRDLR